MTILAGHREQQPTICAICARQAESLAYSPSSDLRKAIWICAPCTPLARKTYAMTDKTLNEYESRAVFAAAKVVAPSLVEAVLTELWDRNVEALSAITPEIITAISELPSPAIKDAIGFALATYGATMREEIGNDNPPF